MQYKILVASYSDEITALAFNPTSGSLTITSTITVGHHPSWITSHPEDPSLVFACLEQPDGEVVVLKYDSESGKGGIVAQASCGGKYPCFLTVLGDELLVANVRLYPYSALYIAYLLSCY